MKNLAKIISVICHPMLLPNYGYAMLLSSGAFFAHLSPIAIRVILLIVLISTLILPLLSIPLSQLILRKKIDLNERKDRVYPFFFTILSYFLGAYWLRHLLINVIYSQVLIICALVICIIQLINLRWKISAHMAAIGGLLGIFFGVSELTTWNSFTVAVCGVLVAGLVGSSRLLLEKHTPAQVYAGFALGFTFPLCYLLFTL
ncbi:MAG: hypothetical protein ACK5JS_09655 [Mangrovibacterium sp.]